MKVISRILIFIIAVLIIIGSTIYLISDGFKSQKNQLPLLHEWTTEKQASPDLKNMDWNDPLYQSWMIINLLNDTLSPEEEHCAIDFLNEASLQNNLNEVLTNLLNYKAKQKSALYYLIARWNETYAQSDKKYFEDYINNIFGVQKTLNNPSKRFTISMLLRAILLDTTLTYENAKAVISTHQLVFVNNPDSIDTRLHNTLYYALKPITEEESPIQLSPGVKQLAFEIFNTQVVDRKEGMRKHGVDLINSLR